MIVIKSGADVIYHPLHPDLVLLNPRLTLEDNAAGSLSFKIYESNPNHGSIRKLFPLVTVTRDGTTIFKGRVIRDTKDFCNGKTVETEGKLAFFNDSYIEPFSFQGSPKELFRMLVENHNAQVRPWQQFRVGTVTVKDNNDYIVRSSESTLNTWEALKERCFKSGLGGHIRLRYEADGDYVDWLEDYTKVSAQSIEFARNIISLSQETDASATYTAIRPVGADVEGTKVDIASVNGGKTYLVNEKLAAEYGVIFAPEKESVWEDVTLPENLLKKAEEKLYGSMAAFGETYEIKAVDLNLTDSEIEALDVCEYVPVESRLHGISGKYLLSRADISIASPQNSVYYLGASKRVLSDMNLGGSGTQETVPQKVSALENDAGYISEEKAEELLAGYPNSEEVELILSGHTEEVMEMVSGEIAKIPSGKNGRDGDSAYELAVGSGYAGTLEEWLESLKGEKGDSGQAATIEIGEIITAEAGAQAAVENVGTETAAVLQFTIPRGERGLPGSSGGGDASEAMEALGGLQFGQDPEGNWGYKIPGADAVIPFKKGGTPFAYFPLIGVEPSDLAGTVWLEDNGSGIEGHAEVFILSSAENAAENGIWSGEGENLALSFILPSEPSDKIGAMWIE